MRNLTYIGCCTLLTVVWGCGAPAKPLPTAPEAPVSAAAHNKEGILHYQMSHWNVAKEHFQAAVEADPELAEPHYNLGLTLHQLGSHDEATAHFKKAAELDPRNPAITQSAAYKRHVPAPSSPRGGYY